LHCGAAPASRLFILTSAGRADDARRCRDLGVRWLPKPVLGSHLLAAFREASNPDTSASEPVRAFHQDAATPPLHILLAEDNVVNQRVAIAVLRKLGHSVVVAPDGVAAVRAFESERFDLIFMDVQMPEMDGFEATAAIRQRERTKGGRIPIIAMTAHAMTGDRERCLSADMDGYLSKPLRVPDLIAEIEAHVTVCVTRTP
jgi:CheY-like chemotaxis protein